ncbi:MAG: deoxynucleoside kinase [Gammaproteobacteria bacterium]|nr:deoxynucleoside kinase [Pseudomonadota bacterium]MCH9664033.1 deoxynucleoside kinase [Gammaproteobacteria bacterium]
MTYQTPDKFSTYPWRQPSFIAIEGPIGVGKSTLARRLSELCNANLVLEEAGENDFLPDFYRNQRRFALHTQLSFLIRRTRQFEDLRQSRLFDRCCIADYTLEKNQLFAQLTLSDAEYKLYTQIQELLHRDQIRPDLVIYLQAPVDTLIDRISARGIDYELNIDSDYLRRLCAAYVDFFHSFDACPLLIINAQSIDFVENDHVLKDLARKISEIRHGRHFYNPLPQTDALPLD